MVLRKMGEEPLGAQERVGCRVQEIVAEVLSHCSVVLTANAHPISGLQNWGVSKVVTELGMRLPA